MTKSVTGFSKFNKNEKINWLTETYLRNFPNGKNILKQYWNPDKRLQQLHEEFTENTVSNFYLPFGIAPNFLINGELLALPMAVEESSVVAAASKAAKFWLNRGGFKAEVINTKKIGHVHFKFFGSTHKLKKFFKLKKEVLLESVKPITQNMEKRGGGVLNLKLIDKTSSLENYFQLEATFDTKDSMGANFINSCLERFADIFKAETAHFEDFSEAEKHPEIIMSILSNYVPECLVRAEVSCAVQEFSKKDGIGGNTFVEKFLTAIKIAEVEPYRAVTHNKGIMNGVDAVVIATGNDFRAVEAGIHAYAAKNGTYKSLTHASVENGNFKFWLEIPLAVGTVGGLTNLHPLVKVALEILQKPDAKQLMKIIAVAGLAQNFGAIKSLVTSGIQQGHMKMHLINILNQLEATPTEKTRIIDYYKTHKVTHSSVTKELQKLRSPIK